MNVDELKLDLFRKIDSLDKSKVKEVYGLLVNLINSKFEDSEYDELTADEKEKLKAGINSLEMGEAISHNKVMEKYRKLYSSD